MAFLHSLLGWHLGVNMKSECGWRSLSNMTHYINAVIHAISSAFLLLRRPAVNTRHHSQQFSVIATGASSPTSSPQAHGLNSHCFFPFPISANTVTRVSISFHLYRDTLIKATWVTGAPSVRQLFYSPEDQSPDTQHASKGEEGVMGHSSS